MECQNLAVVRLAYMYFLRIQDRKQTSKLLQENIRLTNETDPGLIAGIKVLVEGKIIDASFRKRFDELASQMNISQGRN